MEPALGSKRRTASWFKERTVTLACGACSPPLTLPGEPSHGFPRTFEKPPAGDFWTSW